jgi:hypothetical protein
MVFIFSLSKSTSLSVLGHSIPAFHGSLGHSGRHILQKNLYTVEINYSLVLAYCELLIDQINVYLLKFY